MEFKGKPDWTPCPPRNPNCQGTGQPPNAGNPSVTIDKFEFHGISLIIILIILFKVRNQLTKYTVL